MLLLPPGRPLHQISTWLRSSRYHGRFSIGTLTRSVVFMTSSLDRTVVDEREVTGLHARTYSNIFAILAALIFMLGSGTQEMK